MPPLTDTQKRYMELMRQAAQTGAYRSQEPDSSVPEEDRSWLMTGLDYIGRPYSALTGLIVGAQRPDIGAGEAFLKGLTGEEYYSGADIIGNIVDPYQEGRNEAAKRWGGLAWDLTVGGVYDPLSYLTFGSSKGAKALQKAKRALDTPVAEGALKGLRKWPGRTEAAKRGASAWSLLRAQGRVPFTKIGVDIPLTPKAINVPAAKALDIAGKTIGESRAYQNLRRVVGGYRYIIDKEYPGLSSFIAERRLYDKEQYKAFADELVDMTEKYPEQARILATHIAEMPELANSAGKVSLHIPEYPSIDDMKRFAEEIRPYVEAPVTATRAHQNRMLQETDAIRDAFINLHEEAAGYDIVSVDDIEATFTNMRSADEALPPGAYLEELLNPSNPRGGVENAIKAYLINEGVLPHDYQGMPEFVGIFGHKELQDLRGRFYRPKDKIRVPVTKRVVVKDAKGNIVPGPNGKPQYHEVPVLDASGNQKMRTKTKGGESEFMQKLKRIGEKKRAQGEEFRYGVEMAESLAERETGSYYILYRSPGYSSLRPDLQGVGGLAPLNVRQKRVLETLDTIDQWVSEGGNSLRLSEAIMAKDDDTIKGILKQAGLKDNRTTRAILEAAHYNIWAGQTFPGRFQEHAKMLADELLGEMTLEPHQRYAQTQAKLNRLKSELLEEQDKILRGEWDPPRDVLPDADEALRPDMPPKTPNYDHGGAPIRVFRGEMPDLGKGRQLSGIQSVGSVVGVDDTRPMAPFEFFTTDPEDAKRYLDADQRALDAYKKKFGESDALNSFETLHGHSPRMGVLREETVAPSNVLDLTDLGTETDSFALADRLGRELGIDVPTESRLGRIPQMVDYPESLQKMLLDTGAGFLGDSEGEFFTWELFRNRTSIVKSKLVQLGRIELDMREVPGMLFAEWLYKNGYDAVAMMHQTPTGPVKHIVMLDDDFRSLMRAMESGKDIPAEQLERWYGAFIPKQVRGLKPPYMEMPSGVVGSDFAKNYVREGDVYVFRGNPDDLALPDWLEQAGRDESVIEQTARPKEPWEMTYDELREAVVPHTRDELERARPILREIFPDELERIPGEDPWNLRRAIERGDELPRTPMVELSARKRRVVQQALADEKPVPRRVLEEYRGEKWADDALADWDDIERIAGEELPDWLEQAGRDESVIEQTAREGAYPGLDDSETWWTDAYEQSTPVMENSRLEQIQTEIEAIEEAMAEANPFDKAMFVKKLLESKTRPTLGVQFRVEEITGKKLGVSDAAKAAHARGQRILDATLEEMMSRVRKVDPNAKPPIGHYVPHSLKKSRSPIDVLKRKRATKVAVDDFMQSRRMYWTKQGLTDTDLIEEIATREMKEEFGMNMPGWAKKTGHGQDEHFLFRKHKNTLLELEYAGFPVPFEKDFAVNVNDAVRTRMNWCYGYDLYDFAAKKFGKHVDELTPELIQSKRLVPIDYYVPFTNVDNPFKSIYIPKDLDNMLQGMLHLQHELTSDAAFKGILDYIGAVRRWWTSWTLLPFPAWHARNLGADMQLSAQAGAKPWTSTGRLAFPAAADAVFGELPLAKKMTQGHLQKYMAELNKRFPDISKDDLLRIMRREEILEGAMRDVDLLMQGAQLETKTGTRMQRAAREFQAWMPLHPDIKQSKLLAKTGRAGQHVQDSVRAACFMDLLLQNARIPGLKWEDALDDAIKVTRKALFDYHDLTATERHLLKNLIPFYTFTAKNIPRQLEVLFTEPKRFAYLARAYNGMWNTDDELFERDMLPEWLKNALGVPIRRKTVGDHDEWVVWSPTGWIPMTEINELAEMFRSPFAKEGRQFDEAGKFWLSRLNPMFKEPIEQLMNYDSFTGRKIDNGEVRDVLGITVNPRIAHGIRNIRFVTEIDRLNPGGLFTKLGQVRGHWKDERPHRREAPGLYRGMRALTGMSVYDQKPLQEMRNEFIRLKIEGNKLRREAQRSARRGQVSEAEKLMGLAREKQQGLARLRDMIERHKQGRARMVEDREKRK